MPADARELWWPPFGRLYSHLSSTKLNPSSQSAHTLQTSLEEYDKWLGLGVAFFGKRNEQSKQTLERETSLTIGEKKLPVDPKLRKAALDVSCYLRLDEVQSYILLRRWVLAGRTLDPSGLAVQQLKELAGEYARERICLLKATEELLWLGEEITSDAFSDVVESTLSKLLDAGLEEAAFKALQSNLEGDLNSGSALVAPTQVGYTSLFGFGGDGAYGTAGAASPTGLSDEQLAFERCALLNILTLIYYHPRKQCTPDRFLALSRLFHKHLFTAPLPRQQQRSGTTVSEPQSMALKLATVLLLEMLDVDKALSAVAEGTPLTQDNYAFAAADTRRQVHTELSSWWGTAGTAHSPVLLAWSAVLCLVGKSASEGVGVRVSADEFGGHAQRAHELGALEMLCQLTCMEGMPPNAAEMSSNILLSVVSSVVCAFDLSPTSMPLHLTDQMVTILCNLYKDQPALCDSFWLEERRTEDPLRRFLEDVRGLFPAFPTFLYRALCALCATSDSVVAANAFLAGLDALVCLHTSQEDGILLDANNDGNVYTEDVVPLPGSKVLTLPQGVLGEVFPAPEGATTFPASALMLTWQGDEAPDGLSLVRWGLSLADGTGQWILLCRAFESLAALQQVYAPVDGPPSTQGVQGALCELSAALRLLCAICTHDPQTALDLLHVEVPAGDASLADGGGGPDMLTLACHAVTVLCQVEEPPMEAIGDCFLILDALVQSVPGRVHSELLATLQLTGGLLAEAVQAQDIPLLSRVTGLESRQGQFPATQAFLRLATSLISSAAPGQELQVFVTFVLRRLLPEHHRWRYASRAERWRVAGAALRMLRHALQAPTVQPAVEDVLRYDVGVAATLLPALPPNARQLEALSLEPHAEVEVVAVEGCCREWLRLLPVLLPEQGRLGASGVAAEGTSFLGAGALFKEGLDLEGAPSAAAHLLSYLTYAFFGDADRALVVAAANSLAAAAATATPGIAFSRLFPSGTGASDLSPEAKAVFASALDVEKAAAHPYLTCSACALLTSAVLSHASLADALMFPSDLEQRLREQPPKENKDGNTAAALVLKKKEDPKNPSSALASAGSCLDAMWGLLQHVERLRKEQPEVLAALMRLLSMLWQSGPSTFRPVGLLRQEPQLWRLLTSLLPPPGDALPPAWEALAGSVHAEGQQGAAWQVAAEAHVLQILAAEAFMAAASWSPKEALPKELEHAVRQHGSTLPSLLQRYCTPLPTASVLNRLHSAAAAAGLEILGAALADGVVWPSLGAPPSLVHRLHAAAVPLLSQFGSREAAVGALTDHAASIAQRNARQPAVQEVAEVVLSLAEVPSRAIAGREYGAEYVLDARLCVSRFGNVLAQQAPAVQSVSSWLGAASWAASLEDARLGAATALRALLAGVHKYSARAEGSPVVPAPSLSQLQDCLGALEAAMTNLVQCSQGDSATSNAASTAAGMLDLHGVHAASVAEGTLVLLLLLRQWVASQETVPDAAAGVCCKLLELVSQWMSALGDLRSLASMDGSDSSSALMASIQTSTTALLTAGLLAVEALPESQDSAVKTGAPPQEVQEASLRCLPTVLHSCQTHRSQHLAELAALASAMMARLVADPARLPVVRSSLQLGALLGWLLKRLVSHGLGAQHEKQQQATQHAAPGAARQLSVLGLGQGVQQAAQQAQREEAAAAGAPGKAELAALSLALQVAQVVGGPQLLCEQGVVGHVLLLSKWLLAPEGGDLLGMIPRQPPGHQQPVDYSNAYRQDGSPNPAHQLWCSCLSLMGLLLAALPGYEVVEQAALELAVAGEGRLLLAVEPAAGTTEQPLTLGMVQEARYTLFFLTGLARLAGRWRVLLPDTLPQLRQASASLLEFVARPHHHHAHCVALGAEEKALAKPSRQQDGINEGWVRALEHGKGGVGGQLAVLMAEKLYSCAQFALSFQLATAPEVYEEEAGLLGPEWPSGAVLSELQDQCLAVAQTAPRQLAPVQFRLYRTVGQVLGGTVQLQQAMAVPPAHQQLTRITRAVEQLEEALR